MLQTEHVVFLYMIKEMKAFYEYQERLSLSFKAIKKETLSTSFEEMSESVDLYANTKRRQTTCLPFFCMTAYK